MVYCRLQDHPALFMEMRLGKTLVAVRRCMTYVPRIPSRGLRVLVAAPTSALPSWEKELLLEGQTNYTYLEGTIEVRKRRLRRPFNWFLVNREAHLYLPELANKKWDAVIIDESTSIKNVEAQVTKFFSENFREVPHRWTLAGRPNPQTDMEFWPQLNFLDGIAFGCSNFYSFRNRFFKPSPFGHNWYPQLGAATKMKKAVADRAFVLRRKHAGLDVPKVYEQRHPVLPAALRKVYQVAEKEFYLKYQDHEEDTKWAPVKFQWLRQLASGFIDKKLVWPGKLNELEYLLNGELSDDPVVVWFNYNHEGQHALEHLREAGITCEWLEGKVSKPQRRKVMRDFQDGRFRVILLQQAIAQMGADLSRSDTNIYFSPPLGTLARSQTEDRILELMKGGPLLTLDLLTQDSIDIECHEDLQAKNSVSRFFLDRVVKLIQKRRAA